MSTIIWLSVFTGSICKQNSSAQYATTSYAIVYDIVYSGVQAQSLVVTSLPAVLFQTNGGVHNITAGSVIQLYCSVQSTTASFSWTKDGRLVVIDVLHLRERTCNDSTTTMSVLTVDNFQSSDSGAYQCMAIDGDSAAPGDTVELRGI